MPKVDSEVAGGGGGGEVRLKLDVQGHGGEIILDIAGQEG